MSMKMRRANISSRGDTASPSAAHQAAAVDRPADDAARARKNAVTISTIPPSAIGNALDADRHAEQMIEAGDDPVAQDGLVDPRLVVEPGVDVVAALHHLARSFHVERLVGVPDGRTAQVDEIGADGQEEQQPMLNAEC